MRAAFLTGPESIEVRDGVEPGEAADLVSLDIRACGICGSDLHGWRHPEQTVAAGGAALPGIGGHEIVAVTGRGDSRRRVVVEPNLAGSCGVCPACRSGRAWFCRNRSALPSWGFAEAMQVREQSLFAVPDGVPDHVASLTEPLACAVHAFRSSHTAGATGGTLEGRRVAVVGAGVAGLLAAGVAARLGAEAVAVVARYPHQAETAARLGATDPIDPGGPELVRTLRSYGADVVVEAVGGTAGTFDTAVRSVQPGGEVIVLGLFDDPQLFDTRRAVFRELRLLFPVTYSVRDGRHDFDVALEMLAAGVDEFAPLVSHRFGLDSTAEAFATAADKRTGALRVVVEP
jgi:threonine dehydrogenase-like Zn-dependent dehydrogenase